MSELIEEVRPVELIETPQPAAEIATAVETPGEPAAPVTAPPAPSEVTPPEAIIAESTPAASVQSNEPAPLTPEAIEAIESGQGFLADGTEKTEPFIPDFDSPEVQALRDKMAKVKAQEAAEAMTLEEALGVVPVHIRGVQYYIQEPSVEEEFFLRDYLDQLDQAPKNRETDLKLVEALRPCVCRYNPATMDVEPITAEEAPRVLGRKSIPRVIRAIFGTGPADPNA